MVTAILQYRSYLRTLQKADKEKSPSEVEVEGRVKLELLRRDMKMRQRYMQRFEKG